MALIRRLARELELMLRRPPRQQYAALCYRKKEMTDETEVLLLTSRDTGRWVIPKGWPMKGKQAHAVAEREAYEEAGVRGKAQKEAFGYFSYEKKMKNGVTVTCLVEVHLLKVAEMLAEYPEKEVRRLEWVSAREASQRVNEPELRNLFLVFDRKTASKVTESAQKRVGS